MTVDIRAVTEDEVPAWLEAMATGFLRHLAEGEVEGRRAGLDLERTIGAFDGDRVVGTLRSWQSDLTLPGGALVQVAALTNVTVTSTHRRQGVLTRMLAADLAASVERGEVGGILVAAEYGIYGRYGYGPAAEHATMTIDANAAAFGERRAGSVQLGDLDEVRKIGPGLYEVFRRQQPASISRPDLWWDRTCRVETYAGQEPYKGYVLVGRSADGEPDGYVRYHVDDKWDDRRPAAVLWVDELLATTPEAYERLWRACCEVDWVAEVRADDRSPDEALPWLVTDGRAVRQSARADFLWLRPLDVPALLGSRTYLAPGRVVLEVNDALGYAAGRYALDGRPDGASCARATDAPGLTLDVDVLGAAALGGPSLRVLADAGRVTVHDPAALAAADAMFRATVTPWCSTWF